MSEQDRMPPMEPNTDEASPEQLEAAREQGRAYGRALELMTTQIADDGGERRAGEFLVGYAVEQAEGMYEWRDGELVWREPEDENLHVEVSVRDAADGRFVPGVRVEATLIDADGTELGPYEQPLLWHPMLYHYGRNWTVPHGGDYSLRVRVEPPRFSRHDDVNGCRFVEPVEVEFADVHVNPGRD
jgi:hypothetical protein